MRIRPAHQLIRPLGRGIERGRLVSPRILRVRQRRSDPYTEDELGIDQMFHGLCGAAPSPGRKMPRQVRRGIGKGLLQRIPHPCLAARCTTTSAHRPNAAMPMVGQIETVEHNPDRAAPAAPVSAAHRNRGCSRRPRQPRAARQQRRRHMVADKPGRTGDHHTRIRRMNLSSRSVSTTWPRAMWLSWIRAVSASGTSNTKSHNGKAGPPSPPGTRP